MLAFTQWKWGTTHTKSNYTVHSLTQTKALKRLTGELECWVAQLLQDQQDGRDLGEASHLHTATHVFENYLNEGEGH